MLARFAIFALAVAAFASARPASAANWLEKNFWLSGPEYTAEVPLCEDDQVLARIQSRFAQKEREYWNSELKIIGWEYIREQAFMPWHYAAIPRRFCIGFILMTAPCAGSTIRSRKTPASSGPPGVSNGVSSASTAIGPTLLLPRLRGKQPQPAGRRAPDSNRIEGANTSNRRGTWTRRSGHREDN
jgi:hypothetical protein